MKLTVQLLGLRPLLMHNGRIANPIDPWTQRLKPLVGKRRKTDDDYVAIMRIEARAAAYETGDNLLGFPTANVWRSVFDAAKAYKRGQDVRRALLFEETTEPLLVAGEPVDVDEYLADPDHIFYRAVRVQQNTTMRARPIIPLPWSTTHTFDVLEDVFDSRDLAPIFERAGRLIGVGDYRPTYGQYRVEIV
jgi:hypothetical protein